MNDRGPDLDDLRLSDELGVWFAGEVRQAELDLRRAPLRPARARHGPARGIAAPAAGAILVVVLVIAGISRLPSLAGPATVPTGGAIPSSPATAPEPVASATPAPTGMIEGRYADGIPMRVDGEPVLRIPALGDLAPADDAPFLVGAWTIDWTGVTQACALMTPPPFGPRCNTRWLSDGPAMGDPLFLDSWTPMAAGPVVVRVHRHDARAELCEAADRESCEAMAVIENVVWTGDAVTATAPLTPIEVFAGLRSVVPELSNAVVAAVGRIPPSAAPSATPAMPSPGGGPDRCAPPFPPMTWTVVGSEISYVLVFPSVDAREAVQSKFHVSGIENFGCWIMTGSMFNHEWVAVDNVMVAVQVNVDGPTAAQGKLVEDVQAALERR